MRKRVNPGLYEKLDEIAPGHVEYNEHSYSIPVVFSTQSWKERVFWLIVAGAVGFSVALGLVAGGAAW